MVTVPTSAESSSGFTNFSDLVTLQSGTKTDALGRIFPVGTIFDPATTRAVTSGVLDATTGLTATSTGDVRDPFYGGIIAGQTNFTSAAQKALLNQLPVSGSTPPRSLYSISTRLQLRRELPITTRHFHL